MNHDEQLPDYVAQALQKMLRDGKQREDIAYQKGWEAATAAMVAAAKGVAGAKPPVAANQPAARPKRVYILPDGTRERVIYAFKMRPGSRPSEVARWLQEQGDETKKQTILTMIKRVRKDGYLVPNGDGYKLAEGKEEAA